MFYWCFQLLPLQTSAQTQPPIATTLKDQKFYVGYSFSFSLPEDSFKDYDGDSLTYTATLKNGLTLPSWLSFNNESRMFSANPLDGNIGTYVVNVTADDGNGGIASSDFTINVVKNKPPISKNLQNATIIVNQTFFYAFSADTFQDPDDDILTLTATLNDGSILPSWITFNASSYEFTGNPTTDNIGLYYIKVTANDGYGRRR